MSDIIEAGTMQETVQHQRVNRESINIVQRLISFFTHPVAKCIFVVLVTSTIFALRYIPAFTEPNFYAEDGSVFVQTVIEKNPLATILTPFNGYLVVGQYMLAEFSVDATQLLHLPFYTIPSAIAVFSCLFLGLTVSLPYIFLRKQLGRGVTFVMAIAGAFVPFIGSDYAVIGTLGNLKFAFLYWAFIICLFRIWNSASKKRVFLADALLVLSVLTYAPAVALLPVLVVPYIKPALKAFKQKRFSYLLKPEIISLGLLAVISGVYLIMVYKNGIPKLPGYLDSPYNAYATVKIIFRSTLYVVLFPALPFLRDAFALILITAASILGIVDKKRRWVYLFSLWAILIATVSFVANRPGISEYLLKYGKTPDQFFYAQSVVYLFAIIWVMSPYIKKLAHWTRPVTTIALVVFAVVSFAIGGSGGKNDQIYKHLGTAEKNVHSICSAAMDDDKVTLQLYPSEIWKWQIPANVACH